MVGAVLGIALTFGIKTLMNENYPTLPFPIEPMWILGTSLLALVGAIGGAVYPALKAAFKDPIDALAYE